MDVLETAGRDSDAARHWMVVATVAAGPAGESVQALRDCLQALQV